MTGTSRQLDDYIRANRDRYTREAITGQLEAAGHHPAEIAAAWDRVEANPSVGGAPTDAGAANGAWIAAALLAGLGVISFLVLAAFWGFGAAGLIGWALPLTLVVISPVAWFGRHRPLGVVALGAFLLLLPWVVLIGLAGVGFTGRPGPVIWIALYLMAGGLAVWWAFRWNPPQTVLSWVLSVLGTVALVLLVAGGTCLVSLPFINA